MHTYILKSGNGLGPFVVLTAYSYKAKRSSELYVVNIRSEVLGSGCPLHAIYKRNYLNYKTSFLKHINS